MWSVARDKCGLFERGADKAYGAMPGRKSIKEVLSVPTP